MALHPGWQFFDGPDLKENRKRLEVSVEPAKQPSICKSKTTDPPDTTQKGPKPTAYNLMKPIAAPAGPAMNNLFAAIEQCSAQDSEKDLDKDV